MCSPKKIVLIGESTHSHAYTHSLLVVYKYMSGQRSAVSEHEDRKAAEETGRGDGRVGAEGAGTAMALRGEHDARSASTQDEGRLN